jgi:hypothetical protein
MNLRFACGGSLNSRFTTNQWDRERSSLTGFTLNCERWKRGTRRASAYLPIKKSVAYAKIEVEFVEGPGRPKARLNRFLSPTDTKTASRNLAPKTQVKLKRREQHAIGTDPRRLIGSYQLCKSRSCQHSNTAIASPTSKITAQTKHRAQPK